LCQVIIADSLGWAFRGPRIVLCVFSGLGIIVTCVILLMMKKRTPPVSVIGIYVILLLGFVVLLVAELNLLGFDDIMPVPVDIVCFCLFFAVRNSYYVISSNLYLETISSSNGLDPKSSGSIVHEKLLLSIIFLANGMSLVTMASGSYVETLGVVFIIGPCAFLPSTLFVMRSGVNLQMEISKLDAACLENAKSRLNLIQKMGKNSLVSIFMLLLLGSLILAWKDQFHEISSVVYGINVFAMFSGNITSFVAVYVHSAFLTSHDHHSPRMRGGTTSNLPNEPATPTTIKLNTGSLVVDATTQ